MNDRFGELLTVVQAAGLGRMRNDRTGWISAGPLPSVSGIEEDVAAPSVNGPSAHSTCGPPSPDVTSIRPQDRPTVRVKGLAHSESLIMT